VESLAGLVANPRLVDGKPRGDIVLNDNQAGNELRSVVKLAAKAQGKLRNVGLSHVANYRFAPDRKAVESVLSVFSVDLVIGPATTSSLYESHGSPPCAPFNASEWLKFLDYPEFKSADWNPHQALEAIGHWDTEGFDPEQALESLSVVDGFDPSKALSGISFN
jgi:hypothetical protein